MTPETDRSSILVGIAAESVDSTATQLGAVLGLEFEKHGSSYWGDYCLHRGAESGEIRIYKNEDPLYDPQNGDPPGEYYFEPGYSRFPVLVSAYSSKEWCQAIRDKAMACFPGSVAIRTGGAG